MVVLDVSHGVTAMFAWSELSPMFAGVRLVAVVQPILGDTRNVATRGSTLASKYAANPTGPVGHAWGDTLNSLGAQDGDSCGRANYSQGGGHGINGCGCNFTMAVDSSQYWAQQDIDYQSWSQFTNESYDADGSGWYEWRATCNYDSSSYKWGL